jgi:hypothetical protein
MVEQASLPVHKHQTFKSVDFMSEFDASITLRKLQLTVIFKNQVKKRSVEFELSDFLFTQYHLQGNQK